MGFKGVVFRYYILSVDDRYEFETNPFVLLLDYTVKKSFFCKKIK
jgi:hypothetical protein